MEAKKILFHSLREITANLMTTYERLIDDEPSQKIPLIQQQMPSMQLDYFIEQAYQKKYTILLQTKQHQQIVGRIVRRLGQQKIIITSLDHRQNALLPINSLQSIQRQ